MMDEVENETELLSRDKAKELAQVYRTNANKPAKSDPLKEKIPYSLLAAEHIRDYVLETGLIAPFYVGGGKNSRLKKAAYEGRMGECAYWYRPDNIRERVLHPDDESLCVPANSIVFVECDLDFRLPEFIALRFNLQIQHVHRGLLLGTGPLVDPGFWGKLCIPLHNLTDKDYVIPRDEGIIWLEFTKTTSDLTPDEKPIGRPPLSSKEFWDITQFLDKAAKQYVEKAPPIALRSSLPSMFDDANKKAKDAESHAEAARNSATRMRNVGFIAGFGLLVALVALWVTFYNETVDYAAEVSPLRDEVARLELANLSAEAAQEQMKAEFEVELQELKILLQDALKENRSLADEVAELRGLVGPSGARPPQEPNNSQ